jgi:hypothetical protein
MVTKNSKSSEAITEEITDCRATDVGVAGFAECQCSGPVSCAYALPFGYAFLCRHPRMSEIIAKTKKERVTPASTT